LRPKFSSLIVASVLSLAMLGGATSAKAETAPGKKHVPDAVSKGTAIYVSHVDAKQQYELAIALPINSQANLTKLIAEQQDHNSGMYHKWLTVDQFADQFSPSKADYAKVVAYLMAQGFAIEFQHANRLAVSFTGNTEQIERAFHVTMNNYKHPTEDRTFYAPDSEPTLTGLNVPVLLIAGLDNYVIPHPMLKNRGQMHHATPTPQPVTNSVISHANPPVSCYGPPYSVDVGNGACNTYTPANMRTAYYGSGSLNGTGQQIGILGFGGFFPADLTGFAAVDNNATVPTVNFLLGAACTASCSDGEQMLDVLWSAGMAPGITNINFFTNSSNDLTIINAEASSTLSSVYSSSWGWGFTNHAAEDTDFQEMATQGQTFLNATGDDGGYNSSTWSYPSANPYITEVGGTQVVTSSIGGPWSAEYGWPGSSGGVPPAADAYAIPSWQSPVNGANGVSTTKRSDPDVAGEADYEMLGCTGNKRSGNSCEDTYGGTSYAAPTWAGIFAMLNQYSVSIGNGTLGFANYELYEAGLNGTLFSGIFHDVTICGGIDGPGPGPDCNSSDEGTPVTGFNPGTGFDDVTGWGGPNASALITSLSLPTLAITAGPYTRASSIGFTLDFPEFAGTVTITAKPSGGTATSVGTCTLASGTCTATVTGATIGWGTYSMQGVYQQTTTSTKKYTTAQNITIAADTTSTIASASPSSILSTASTSVTATVADSTVPATSATGTVTFTLGSTGGTSLGSCTLASGTCSATVQGSALAIGSNTIYANYAGVSGDFTASSGSTTVTVTVPPQITFTSVSHNFGQVAVGTAAATYGLTATNTGAAAYTFAVNFTPAHGFTTANNCPATLAVGAKCQINFYFTPTASGAVSAMWSVTTSATSFSPSNGGTLTGSGTTQGGVSITTAGHNFGTVMVGTTSPTYGTVISNSTMAAVTLSLGMVTAPFHSVTNCGTTLAAGASCNLQFTFTPTATGTVQQVYALSSSVAITAGGNPLPNGGVTLTGTGH
jgi:subtilase family serine protease